MHKIIWLERKIFIKNTIHFFPGGNTAFGFHSFYHNVLPQKKAKHIFVIKGGPGTGKSSLMKKVAKHFLDKEYDVEYHHCSSDNNSIDGIVIKKLSIAFFDGTAPHVIDPINPGVVDEIINLGEFWEEEGFKPYHNLVINTNKKVGYHFKRAYHYLGAAKKLHDDWFMYNLSFKDEARINTIKEEIKSQVFKNDDFSNVGEKRELFISAFTPSGIVTYIDSIIKLCNKIIVLKGGPGTGKTSILSFIANEAIKRGHDTTILHDPLTVNRIEHIYIPSLSLAIVTINEITNKTFACDYVYELDSSIDEYEISKTKELFYLLINEGISHLSDAKHLHDELEAYYIPNMKFDLIEKKTEKLIKRLEKYEHE